MKYLALWNKGENYYTHQNFIEALKCFETAYTYNSSNSVRNYIGCCHMELKNYDKAIEVFQSIISTSHWETPWYNIGRVYLKLNRNDEAFTCFNEALDISPDCDACHFYLGVYYEKTKDYKKAINSYKKAIEFGNDQYDIAMYWSNIGICSVYLEDYETAITCFDEALIVCNQYTKAKHLKEKLLIKLRKEKE